MVSKGLLLWGFPIEFIWRAFQRSLFVRLSNRIQFVLLSKGFLLWRSPLGTRSSVFQRIPFVRLSNRIPLWAFQRVLAFNRTPLWCFPKGSSCNAFQWGFFGVLSKRFFLAGLPNRFFVGFQRCCFFDLSIPSSLPLELFGFICF